MQSGDSNSPEDLTGGNKHGSNPQADPPRRSSHLSPHMKDPRKLFVGGLPPDMAEDEFRSCFSEFGAVLEATVMIDRETHRSRGFGFVKFSDVEVAKMLLKMGDHADGVGRLLLKGKICEIKPAQPRGQMPRKEKENAGSSRWRNQGHGYQQFNPVQHHYPTVNHNPMYPQQHTQQSYPIYPIVPPAPYPPAPMAIPPEYQPVYPPYVPIPANMVPATGLPYAQPIPQQAAMIGNNAQMMQQLPPFPAGDTNRADFAHPPPQMISEGGEIGKGESGEKNKT